MAKVKGTKFAEADEKFDRKKTKKDAKSMKTAGIATALNKAEKEEGYSKKPKLKGQKKKSNLISKGKKVI